MGSRRTNWLLAGALAGVALLIVAIYAGWILFRAPAEDYAHRMRFDAAVWRQAPPGDDASWPVRLRMVDDLIDRKLLDGLTTTEVRSLLGPVEPTEKFRNWHMVYYLGPERGLFRIDSEWFVILFDGELKVAKYEIVRD
jgi:hypothetical protein